MSGMVKKALYVIAFIIITLLITFIIELFSGTAFSSFELTPTANVALIPIDGPIMYGEQGLFAASPRDAAAIAEEIDTAGADKNIDVIMLEINSPGGTVVASKEISEALERSDKYKIALIREAGASGAYWISVHTDLIIADSMSITGSVGVIASYLDFSDFLNEYGVRYERLAGGKYKDLGTPLRNMSVEERNLLQSKIDIIHNEFKRIVKEKRGLTNQSMEIIGTGEFFIGSEAYDLGLVDVLGNKKTAETIINEKFETKQINYYSYEKQVTFMDALFGNVKSSFYNIGLGIGQGLTPNSKLQFK